MRKEFSSFPGIDCTPWAEGTPGGDEERNPFSFVTIAHLEALKARRQLDKYRLKLSLIRRLVREGWRPEYGEQVLRFLDWMLQLPGELEELYDGETKTILEEERMPCVTSWERRALKQGLEQGLEQGLGQGALKEKRRVLCRLVEKKFGGGVSEKDAFEAFVEKIEDPDLPERAIDALLDAESREDVLSLLER